MPTTRSGAANMESASPCTTATEPQTVTEDSKQTGTATDTKAPTAEALSVKTESKDSNTAKMHTAASAPPSDRDAVTAGTSSKNRLQRLATAKYEVARLQLELAAARLAVIETEEGEENQLQHDATWHKQVQIDTDWKKQVQYSYDYEKTESREQAQPSYDYEKPAREDPKLTSTVFIDDKNVKSGPHPNPMADLTAAITGAIAAGQRRGTAVELPIFAGSHQHWLAFKAAYKETAGSFSECENTARLRASVKGRAREAIEELFISGAPAADIVKALESRFGRPDAIALAELERLRALPRLADNPREICIFSNRVSNIVATLRALDRAYYLFNPEVTKHVIEKFSLNIRYRWFDFAAQQTKEEADLLKLNRFLQRESEICGPYAAPEYMQSQSYRQVPQHDNKFQRALTTTEKRCPVCDGVSHTATAECNPETVSCAWGLRPRSFLKMLPVQVSGLKGCYEAWALLDDGSTVTLIDDRLAEEVGAEGPTEPLYIEAIADSNIHNKSSRRVKITLGTEQKYEIEARTVSNLSLSAQRVDETVLAGCPHLIDIKSKLVYTSARPNILIGQDNWHLLLAEEVRRGKRNEPVASLTPLGWVLHGAQTRSVGHRVNFINNIEESMDKQLQKYFDLESLTINPAKPGSDPEERAKNILEQTVKEVHPGEYEAGLLWKNDKVKLPDNYVNSLNRLYSTERRLDKDAMLKEKYEAQMDELIKKGYAEPAPLLKTPDRTWYLPHFPVLNPMKPGKVRIVHDAAATTKGVSLNDHLLSGPDLLQSLPGVLMRFRCHPIAVTADIAEMFMRVSVRTEDRDALRYLWRGGERGDTPPREYRMTSLIFGATCSPSTAIFVKNFNAYKYNDTYPAAVKAIERNHYVDDYLDSFRTTDEAITTSRAVQEIHRKGNFNLRGWVSNSTAVRDAMGGVRSEQPVSLDQGALTERVLGLLWNHKVDNLSFNLDLARIPPALLSTDTPTKRQALKIVMSLYDPLGLASIVTVRGKCLLQEAWRLGIEWDSRFPEDIAAKWQVWLKHLINLREVHIPRAYPGYSDASDFQLHVMVDASEEAYCAALYWRATTPDGEVHVSLVLAKARVTPLKVTSIPRLELQAAVMGTRMAEAVKKEHEKQPTSTTYWTDSKTVLQWIRNGSRTYRPFVAHRIAAIEELTKVNEWRWVPTKLNCADDGTRDVPHDFTSKHRWFTGPDFLRQDPGEWPKEATPQSQITGEERTNYVTKTSKIDVAESIPCVARFSRWERYLRTTARVLQFISLCRREKTHYKRTRANKNSDMDWNNHSSQQSQQQVIRPRKGNHTDRYRKLNTILLQRAEHLIVRASQLESFPEEMKALTDNIPVSRNSKIKSLSVKLNNNLIVLESRIEATHDVTDQVKTPPILDGRHPTAKLYIDFVHRFLHHARVELTVNEVKQRYWVLHLRPTTRQLVHRCPPCTIRRASPPSPPTGNHPACRLAHHQRAFTFTGLDYFGPLLITVGRSVQKRYVALFTCLTTRAVHLEVAHSLTTDSAIMALRRMIARRGCPTELWSDNGSNLRGAEKELRRALNDATEDEATRRGINWRFIPAGAPFMGGAWERMVRAVKTALEVTLHERHPSEETLATLLAEAEFTVNSRPLTHVSVDPEDPEAITPNHFLLGGSGWTPAPGAFSDRDVITRSTWRASQRLADMFWSRWLREYLPELQHRREPHGRGPALTIGDVVLVVDNSLPRNTWPRGVVTAVFPGADGVVRVADVRTKGGVLRRPTKKLVVLPTEPRTTSLAHGDTSTPRR